MPLKLKCPVCGRLLGRPGTEKRLLCEGGKHSFDIARQGYANLLLPQKKGASVPGDSDMMVKARTGFLNAGYYQPFSDAVNAVCAEELRGDTVADAGCGEGYYSSRLVNATPGLTVAGFDLSKPAVSHAAASAKLAGIDNPLLGAAPGCCFGVASLFEMPLCDGSADGIVNLFAPVAGEEFARVLSDDGFLLVAVPGEEHLLGLKRAVYDRPYLNELRRDEIEGFRLTRKERVSYEAELRSNTDILNLFAMTPYYWKTSEADKAKLNGLDSLKTPVCFDLLVYRKNKKTGASSIHR
ncbi:MAG: methyltransferase domain-containing protein [Clostridia bacterium]|nr:methyltransferase domain-containing protein [Clostridia bacterium]